MCRKRGRIVLVGVTGLELSRDDFYKKEISFQVSCSYGPGRYDPGYEDKGHDYPVGYVRWTEQRNFEAVLDLHGRSAASTSRRSSRTASPLDRADAAYEVVGGERAVARHPARVSIAAGEDGRERSARRASRSDPSSRRRRIERVDPAVAFIGAGNYATGVLIPAFKAAGARLVTVASSAGVTAVHAGRKFGFSRGLDRFVGRRSLIRPSTRSSSPPGTTRTRALVVQALEAGKPSSSRSRSA